MKNGKVYMKHNSLGDDVPIVVILRAMGAMSDQEIVQLVSGGGGLLVWSCVLVPHDTHRSSMSDLFLFSVL